MNIFCDESLAKKNTAEQLKLQVKQTKLDKIINSISSRQDFLLRFYHYKVSIIKCMYKKALIIHGAIMVTI